MPFIDGDEKDQGAESGMSSEQTKIARLANRLRAILLNGESPLQSTAQVSVIVISSRPDWTFACVRTIVNHTKMPFNIYVVPNVEDVYTTLRECYHAVQSQLPEDLAFFVHVLEPQPGIDVLNAVLEQIETDFVAVLQDHAFVPKNWLKCLLWPFYEDESITLTAPTVFEEISQELVPKITTVTTLGDLNEINRLADWHRFGQWDEGPVCSWTCWIARSTLFTTMGRFNTTIKNREARMCDWLARVLHSGHKVVRCRDVYVHVLSIPSGGWSAVVQKSNDKELMGSHNAVRSTEVNQTVTPETFDGDTTPPLVSMVVLHSGQTDEDLFKTWKSVIGQTYSNIEIVLVASDPAQNFTRVQSRITPDVTLLLRERKSLDSMLGAIQRLCQGVYIGFVETGVVLSSQHVYNLVDLLYRANAVVGFPMAHHGDMGTTHNRVTLSGLLQQRTHHSDRLIGQSLADRGGALVWTPSPTAMAKMQIIHRDGPYCVISEE